MVILIVDDEAGVRNSLLQALKKKHELISCADVPHALKELEGTAIDVVITDFLMPGMTGIELIKKGKEISPSTSFLLMTAFGSVDQAVEAIRLGADDYFMKPFDIADLEHRVQRIEDLRSWKASVALKSQSRVGSHRLLGESKAIRAAHEFIEKVAPVPSPVLLLGPSGSGKEVVAQAIHEAGPRAVAPFIAINCASLNEQLMESELFGYVKGAFTGATADRPGKFELAAGGTLFLDEVGELSPPLQAKLLRVIQEREFFRVGGTRRLKTDARVIAATHRNLKEMVKGGTFREDLYFRLNVLACELPPLSERREDVPILIRHFWEKLTRELGRPLKLSPEAMECLCGYTYPGNVRELQNVLERLVVLGADSGVISPTALPAELHPSGQAPGASSFLPKLGEKSLTEIVDELEAGLIRQALDQAHHNQVKAAELLHITRGMLLYKMKKHGLTNRDLKVVGE